MVEQAERKGANRNWEQKPNERSHRKQFKREKTQIDGQKQEGVSMKAAKQQRGGDGGLIEQIWKSHMGRQLCLIQKYGAEARKELAICNASHARVN